MQLLLVSLLQTLIGTPPKEVELDLLFFLDRVIYQSELLIMLVSEVHRMSVPDAEESSLGLSMMIGEYSYKSIDKGLYSF